jgi:hypothetical protein
LAPCTHLPLANPEELHTPTSTAKKLEGDNGDKKKKLKLNDVLFENKAWQEFNIVFRKLLKWKTVFAMVFRKCEHCCKLKY